MSSSDKKEEDEDRVVLQQRLLKTDEVFVYRIPPMKTSSGHRAEDWELAKPLETCSLIVEIIDDALYCKFFAEKPKQGGPDGATEPALFAQAKIKLDDDVPYINHWVEPVVDSSRYFVIRISDGTGKRQAHIGIGFRERDDASNFRMSLQEYENSLRKEKEAEQMHQAYEEEIQTNPDSKEESDGSSSGPTASKLSLKEGEKLHINLKGSKPRRETPKKSGGGGGPVLLKKPPKPPPSSDEISVELSGIQIGKSKPKSSKASSSSRASSECDSGAAVADFDDTDDEWGEFESS
mmetsp:Transcript_27252/g.38327  ORF Transcript_27252/g.38327 Transcript_27252/m.38327 type:complete len:293 (-) Transcript_27252:206-1084(-)